MCDINVLTPSVQSVIIDCAHNVGIQKPAIFSVSKASKNGDSYSGEIYRVVVAGGKMYEEEKQEEQKG